MTGSHTDDAITINATTGSGYQKELWQFETSVVQGVEFESSMYALRDFDSTTSGHQTTLRYGTTSFRYYVSTDLSSDDRVTHPLYSYDIHVTRPYPPLKIYGFSSYSSLGSTRKTHPENRTEPIESYNARGTGHVEADQTWSLSGDDNDDFTLDSEAHGARNKLLRFRQAPDYENPIDSNRDNVYEVTIEVTERDETASFSATVTVSDVDSDDGTAISWLGVWNGNIDDSPLAPGSTLEITEDGSLSLSIRPRYAPRQPIWGDFSVNTYITDDTKLAKSTGNLSWSGSGSAWQAWLTVRFDAPQDSDSVDDTVSLTFRDTDSAYVWDTMTFTVNITDSGAGGL